MERSCAVCGKPYEAKTAKSRFCGATCRSRAHRAGGSGEVRELRPAPARPSTSDPLAGRATTAKLEQELRAADRLDTTLGQIALGLAQRFDVAITGADTASALASLARQLEAARGAALQGVGATRSAVTRHRDELAARRARGA
jgi:hypothetical protein